MAMVPRLPNRRAAMELPESMPLDGVTAAAIEGTPAGPPGGGASSPRGSMA